ncbi:craniofacial development protein 2-like [Elysia marginata]|uniref:Craniofacial development protein 2-like n=1 Tax=Elysia marginata TaxID=1093978 RepID=A0AAV4HJM6_9GAST|nr:craniofacial development protein 2-like [Elysia marginata]
MLRRGVEESNCHATVSRDEEGGGSGVGLATPSCKITNATETLGRRGKAGQVTGIMTGGDESREEVSTLTAGLKTTHTNRFFGMLNSKFAKTSIVIGYAPTDVAENEDKDQFYFALQRASNRIPGHDVLLLIGDFNVKIDNNNVNKEKTMGRHGIGDITDNGEHLDNLCEGNNLVIGGSIFQHKAIHKLTWTSPDGRTQSQIDHITISRK